MNRLADTIDRIFRRAGTVYQQQLAAWVQGGAPPSLDRWIELLADAVAPLLERHWRQGARQSIRRVLAAVSRRRHVRRHKALVYICKKSEAESEPEPLWLVYDVDLFNQRITQAVNEAAFAFAQSTFATAASDAEAAVTDLRRDLQEGLESGEALKRLTERVQSIFVDPRRALQIAHTETQRAVHGGQLLSAKESGIVGELEWLASSDACPRCLALNRKRVKLGEPFYVDPKGGPYSVVRHPPLHPS